MTLKQVALLYRAGLKAIKKDYPNASSVYKLSSFVMGAGDMAMSAVAGVHDSSYIAIRFAKILDQFKGDVFGHTSEPMPDDEREEILKALDEYTVKLDNLS